MCECSHEGPGGFHGADEHLSGVGPCGGLDSYGLPCECPSLEEAIGPSRDDDDAEEYRALLERARERAAEDPAVVSQRIRDAYLTAREEKGNL